MNGLILELSDPFPIKPPVNFQLTFSVTPTYIMHPIRPSNKTVLIELVIMRNLPDPRQLSKPVKRQNPAVLTKAKSSSLNQHVHI